MWFLLSLRHLLWPVRLKRVRLPDLFISADQKWMDYAVDKKTIDTASRQTLLGNSLVVVAPKASEQKDFTIDSKTNWTSLLNGGRLAVGDPEHVPAGIYAKEALQKLGAWDTLSPKLAPAEDVRGALALVERNEAPLGIVYSSDAVASKGVKVVATFPEDSRIKKWNIRLLLWKGITMRQ